VLSFYIILKAPKDTGGGENIEGYDLKNTKLSRKLRKNTTSAEEYLWLFIRKCQIKGIKFRRQHAIGNYIVDFVSLKKKLIIELDGYNHLLNKEYDAERSAFFEQKGFKVLRFWNKEVLKRTESVLERIHHNLK